MNHRRHQNTASPSRPRHSVRIPKLHHRHRRHHPTPTPRHRRHQQNRTQPSTIRHPTSQRLRRHRNRGPRPQQRHRITQHHPRLNLRNTNRRNRGHTVRLTRRVTRHRHSHTNDRGNTRNLAPESLQTRTTTGNYQTRQNTHTSTTKTGHYAPRNYKSNNHHLGPTL